MLLSKLPVVASSERQALLVTVHFHNPHFTRTNSLHFYDHSLFFAISGTMIRKRMVESPSLEVFIKCVNVALQYMV